MNQKNRPPDSLKVGAVTDNLPFGVSFDERMIIHESNFYSALKMIVLEPVYAEIASMFNEDTQRHANFGRLYINADNSPALTGEIRGLTAETGANLHVHDLTEANEEMARTALAMSIFLYGFEIPDLLPIVI